MRSISALAVFTLSFGLTCSLANSKTFGNYDRTIDCSGHQAGAEWAEEHDINDAADCPDGNSTSFYEGCVAYTEGSTTEMDDDPPQL